MVVMVTVLVVCVTVVSVLPVVVVVVVVVVGVVAVSVVKVVAVSLLPVLLVAVFVVRLEVIADVDAVVVSLIKFCDDVVLLPDVMLDTVELMVPLSVVVVSLGGVTVGSAVPVPVVVVVKLFGLGPGCDTTGCTVETDEALTGSGWPPLRLEAAMPPIAPINAAPTTTLEMVMVRAL